MKARLIACHRRKTFVLVLDEGDEVIACLAKFARANFLKASHFTAIGAFSDVVTGFYDFSIKDYKENIIAEQVEVLSLTGDISTCEGRPRVHAHVVVGKSDGTAYGGHLLQGHAHPTLEVILTESPTHLHRRMDDRIGIALIDLKNNS